MKTKTDAKEPTMTAFAAYREISRANFEAACFFYWAGLPFAENLFAAIDSAFGALKYEIATQNHKP